MNLHAQIMNLPFVQPQAVAWTVSEIQAAKIGHREARHAAAELVLKADAAMEDAANIIKELCKCYGHPTPDATLARLLALE